MPKSSKEDDLVDKLLNIAEASKSELAKREKEYEFIQNLKPGNVFFDNSVIYYMYVQWFTAKWTSLKPKSRKQFFKVFSNFFEKYHKTARRGYLLDDTTFSPTLEDFFNARIMLRKESVRKNKEPK